MKHNLQELFSLAVKKNTRVQFSSRERRDIFGEQWVFVFPTAFDNFIFGIQIFEIYLWATLL